MKTISYKKYLALKDILKSYQLYKGSSNTRLVTSINRLKNKISQTDYKEVMFAIDEYTENIIKIFANTKRVYVKLEKISKADTFYDDIEEIFKDLDEENA